MTPGLYTGCNIYISSAVMLWVPNHQKFYEFLPVHSAYFEKNNFTCLLQSSCRQCQSNSLTGSFQCSLETLFSLKVFENV